jgi:alkylated DNA repair protein (DNA oxidative demethylase)
LDLFSAQQEDQLTIVEDAYLLKGYAVEHQAELLTDLHTVTSQSPFRRMVTPSGFTMSVAMTNCGKLGWVTARTGYRYTDYDPLNDAPWPAMPARFFALAQRAAAEAGYRNFKPDVCLINRYSVGARMGLHQDKNERNFDHPIVSVSLGLSAVFQMGGLARTDQTLKVQLDHGDIVVWGGSARMRYHGILPLKAGSIPVSMLPALNDCRINLTFRQAG